MTKAISRTLVIIFLLENFADGMVASMTVTPAAPASHHVNGSRCEDMRGGLSLNLRDVGLRRVDSGFTDSSHIGCLNLEDNDIAYVSPSSFNSLPNLLYVNLARNNLSLMNVSRLDGHAHLRTLVLDENSVDENINLEFANEFPELTYLYLRNCSIDDIASLSFAPRLRYLNMSSNNLGNSKLAFLNGGPNKLTLLDLSHNGIENLNASSLSLVTILRLDGNKFERLCGKSYCNEAVLMLEGATNLKWFSASRNAITSVDSDAFDDTVFVEHLDLSYNEIDSIQKGTFEKLEELKYLSLEGNSLKTIPELCNLESLRHLYLAKNLLHGVYNDSFCQIGTLAFADLSDNEIKFVEARALHKLTLLEVLKLSNNSLKTFPSSWLEPLKALRTLYVDGNRLGSLNDIRLGDVHTDANLSRVFAQNNLIDKLYTGSLYREVRNQPNITIQLFDFDDKSREIVVPGEESCKCDCDDDNDISFA